MAVALMVGGSFLSAFLQVLFDRLAKPKFIDCFRRKELDAVQFKKMKMKLSSASHVLDDAEQQQITNPKVKKWLDDLQEVIYDAQDLVDKINLEVEGRSASVLNKETREILDKLEYIVELKDDLGLKRRVGNTILPRQLTTSVIEGCGVYGRVADKKAIYKSFRSDKSGSKMSVIPIVGMSGIGKTTLAQLIYNDRNMEKHYDFKAWVCVTYDFDIFKVTKTIAKRVFTNSQIFDDEDLDFLQIELKKALKGKKLLLVLDDVWIENYSLWSELKKPFDHGECVTKIIVTTQNQKVASLMCTLPSYHLQTMSDDDCWKLFEKHAFINSNPNGRERLEKIGREIVKKCNGLPLAVKSLGSLLRHQQNLKEWESILDSDIWEFSQEKGNILPALWLSYHCLPSHLKRCFAYCSLFPKSHQFDKEDLIKLWMAEDLLQPHKTKRIEEVGEEYFDSLLSRSFFQQSADNSVSFTMHDLLNDLATFIAGDFCLRSDVSNLDKPPSKIRFWSHFEGQNNNLRKHEGLVGAKHLRTLLLPSDHYLKSVLQSKNLALANLMPSLTSLRVLSLYQSHISELPDSIGELKLLRYLNLSKTNIRKIPDAVCTLYNLQTLLLQYCIELESLPTNIVKLTNLRHLDIKYTCIKGMPTKMGSLKDLQTLSVFILGKDNAGSTIKELQDLQDLGGSLHILGLENVVNVEDVSSANLMHMEYLTELEFEWGLNSDDCPQNRENVLCKLQPHTNIKALRINIWGGENFPNWVGDHSFCNLERIELLGCKNCISLPPLGQLPFLKHLVIRKFEKLLKIGDEFYYGGSSEAMPFRCLECLQILYMPACQEWSFIEGGITESFPKLKELVLEAIPNLTHELSLPETIGTETIEIIGCKYLTLLANHCYVSLTRLQISDSCSSMKSIYLDRFPNLTKLDLLYCENLESLVYSDQYCPTLHFLRCLKLSNCPKFERFPQGGLHAPNLEDFQISSCNNLRSLPEQMPSLLPSLQTLVLSECPQLESFSEWGLPSNLNHLSMYDCNMLFASRLQWNLQRLASLSCLNISKIHEPLDSFPEEGLLPTTLTVLRIEWFSELIALNGNAFRGLTSLETLSVSDCCKLHSLPDEGLPVSLTELDISGSEKLEERCQRDKEDWQKVCLIPRLITNPPL